MRWWNSKYKKKLPLLCMDLHHQAFDLSKIGAYFHRPYYFYETSKNGYTL